MEVILIKVKLRIRKNLKDMKLGIQVSRHKLNAFQFGWLRCHHTWNSSETGNFRDDNLKPNVLLLQNMQRDPRPQPTLPPNHVPSTFRG